MQKRKLRILWSIIFLIIFGCSLKSMFASDWPSWRGPNQNGVSDEKGLVANWSLDGKNLIWRANFIGRSTPIVLNGRAYVVGRTGDGIDVQRHVACYDAETGKLIWEDKNNVFHTTVPFSRVGWSSLGGDPETGSVYLFGVDGLFICYDKDGKILWQHSMVEEYNRFSGYGGRTCTPIVDEDLVIINMNYHTWGNMMMPRHRFLAFDKRTGKLVWNSTIKSGPPKNTNYSVPVVALINGIRTLVTGAADGAIYAMKVRTGEQLWSFRLSKGAIQSSVVVDGDKVYACHGRENFDNENSGRIVCIDANGRGDITDTNEVWRYDAIDVGYTSPLLHGGRLYVVTNAGNLHALDAATGKEYWTFNLGTVGKGSPVWADGKILTTEVNGRFHIIQPGDKSASALDSKQIAFDETRPAEIYSSPAVAYGRIYFATEKGLFCLGDKKGKFTVSSNSVVALKEEAPDRNAQVAHIQIVPAETWIYANQSVNFKVRTFDSKGRKLGASTARSFTLNNLSGRIDNNGKFKPNKRVGNQGGHVTARIGDLESHARVMVSSELPITEDLESYEVDKNIPLWPGAWKFLVKEMDGNKVLMKPPSKRNLKRHNLILGPPDMTNYTIQADIMGTKDKRRRPDMGLIANRYYLDLMGRKQRLQIRSWPAELRMMKQIDFKCEPDVWYTMKLGVDIEDDKAIIKGKVWPKDEKEPGVWTITAEDPHPNLYGSPGLYGDAVTNIYYDNIKITRSK